MVGLVADDPQVEVETRKNEKEKWKERERIEREGEEIRFSLWREGEEKENSHNWDERENGMFFNLKSRLDSPTLSFFHLSLLSPSLFSPSFLFSFLSLKPWTSSDFDFFFFFKLMTINGSAFLVVPFLLTSSSSNDDLDRKMEYRKKKEREIGVR